MKEPLAGKKTYIGMLLMGLVGLGYSFSTDVSWLSWCDADFTQKAEVFLAMLTGFAFNHGVRKPK